MSNPSEHAAPAADGNAAAAVRGVKARKPTKGKKKRNLTINLTNCKYDSVRRVACRFGLRPVRDNEEWTVYWTDTSVLLERVMEMRRYQKINHFPGMLEICRKDLLARNMTRMLKLFPKEYNCFPRTWVMPADYGDFQSYCRTNKTRTFIVKPECGSQGKGISIVKNPKDIRQGQHLVCQQYISKPFVIDGFKFDFRIYVLLTSCDPLRVYVYKDGLGRFATIPYRVPTPSNMADVCMHLTNYSINKFSETFVRDDDSGSKRRITTVNHWFRDNGYDLDKIWHDIEDVIIKTLISIHPILKHNYRSCFPNHNRGSACFEILGFDVILDSKLKPWLLEVNHSPSFHTDAPLDKEVKEGLLYDTLNLIDLHSNDKRRCLEEDRKKVRDRLLKSTKNKDPESHTDEDMRAEYEAHLASYEKTHAGGFRRIYPNGNEDDYSKFFDQSTSLCAETAASKARAELLRQQREEIEAKQKEIESYRQKLGANACESKRKVEGQRPESPCGGEKKKSAQSVSVPRHSSFRLSVHLARSQRQLPLLKSIDEESIVPYGSGVTPVTIREEEELERRASLQQRDSLVRGLGVSEQFRVVMDTSTIESRTASRHRPISSVAARPALTAHTSYFQPEVHSASHQAFSLHSEGQLNPVDSTSTRALPGHTPSYRRIPTLIFGKTTTPDIAVNYRRAITMTPERRSVPYWQGHHLGPSSHHQFGLSVVSVPMELSLRRYQSSSKQLSGGTRSWHLAPHKAQPRPLMFSVSPG